MENKLLSLLTICRKAGRLCMGFDPCKEALASGKATVILLSSDISAKTEKEVGFFAAKTSVPVYKTNTSKDEIAFSLGKRVGVITVCDKGFSDRAIRIISETPSDNQ